MRVGSSRLSVQVRLIALPRVWGSSGETRWVGMLAGFYVVWVCAPGEWAERNGLDFLPGKYWALALPAWLSVALLAGVLLMERRVSP